MKIRVDFFNKEVVLNIWDHEGVFCVKCGNEQTDVRDEG